MRPRRRSTRRNHSSAIHPLCESDSDCSIQYLANTDSGSIQVLYHQSHPRNGRSCLRLGSSVQNGSSRPIRMLLVFRETDWDTSLTLFSVVDLPTNRLGRPAHSYPPHRRRRHSSACDASDRLSTPPHYLQWLRIRCFALEVYPAATRSAGSARRDGAGILHCDQQELLRYYWSCNVQRHAGTGGTVL